MIDGYNDDLNIQEMTKQIEVAQQVHGCDIEELDRHAMLRPCALYSHTDSIATLAVFPGGFRFKPLRACTSTLRCLPTTPSRDT